MTRARAALLAATGLGLSLLLLLGRPPSPGVAPSPPPAPSDPLRAGEVAAASPSVETPTPSSSAQPAWQRAFGQEVATVRDACGLDVQTVCEGEACAAVTVAPDLDRFTGWLALLRRSPRFVLGTAARDLGVPPEALPCGAAIGVLSEGAGTATVELPDGTEVWCTPTGPGARWGAAQRALCDAAATRRAGPEAARFGATLRLLSYDPEVRPEAPEAP